MEQEIQLNEHNKQEIQLNEHNKQEYPPMHTAEHILNQTMVRMFGCPRSKNAHIAKGKNKRKCTYRTEKEQMRLRIAGRTDRRNDGRSRTSDK